MIPALSLTLLVLILCGLTWGPGHHIEFAERTLDDPDGELPDERRELIRRERSAYLYGNIAADIINFKAYGGPYNHCHRWTIIDEMRSHSDSDAGEAFLLGYLSHLAADTIAHNHYVPYHLARYARTKGLGHLYWEMSADRFITEERWNALAALRDDPALTPLDELVNRTVEKKALPMKTNKMIFNHVLLISHRDRWRAGMDRLQPRSKVSLDEGFLRRFQDAAIARIRIALQRDGVERIGHVDPNGKDAQARALKARAELSATQRWFPRTMDQEQSEAMAAPWLEGMGTEGLNPRG